MAESAPPSSFISYSWDSDTHKKWVADLARRLRADGVDAMLDRWATAPGDQLPQFMEKAIRESDFVLIICTPLYKRRAEDRDGGVGYEGHIITAEVLTARNHRKFIPVLREGSWEDAAPSWLLGKSYVDLTGQPYADEAYRKLRDTLLGVRQTPPPLGAKLRSRSESTRTAKGSSAPDVSTWSDIRIIRVAADEVGNPRNDGTRGSALYDVPLALSGSPPADWCQLFLRNWKSVWYNMYRDVRISGARLIVILTTIGEVARYHKSHLTSAVDQANVQYRELLEERRRKEQQTRTQHEKHRQHVQDVSDNLRFD